MPRKPSKKPAAPEVPVLKAFTENELLKMRVADLEGQVAMKEAQLAEVRRAFILAQLDPKGLLGVQEKARAEAQKDLEQARTDYRKVLATACERLSVNPDKVSYDRETGVIHLGG